MTRKVDLDAQTCDTIVVLEVEGIASIYGRMASGVRVQ